MDKALKHRVNAARAAIQEQTAFFNKMKGQVASEWKADDTRVTFADFAISEKITKELRGFFPKDQFLSEESVNVDETLELDSRYLWILDPIDGTNNYALGMPSSAISLALLKEGRPVYGLVLDGGTGELLEGGKGHGLFVDGRRYRAEPRTFDEKSSIVAVHFPLDRGRAVQLAPLFERYRVRSLGSAALHLAYVALGRLDGALDERVRLWDIAAALCLMEAAGLPVRFLCEDPFPVRRFAMEGSILGYVGGQAAFLEEIENILG